MLKVSRQPLPLKLIANVLSLMVVIGAMRYANAAQVDEVVGIATIQRGQVQESIVKGTELLEGDMLITAKGGEVLLHFEEGARMAIRSESEVVFSRLTSKVNSDILSRSTRILKGGLRYISGLIKVHRDVSFITSTATIGIRGTDIEIAVVEKVSKAIDQNVNKPGTYLKVNLGAAFLRGVDSSEVDVAVGSIAFGGISGKTYKGGVAMPAAYIVANSANNFIFREGILDKKIQ